MTRTWEKFFTAQYPDILEFVRRRLAKEHAPISTVTLAHELYLNMRQRPDRQFLTPAQFFCYAGHVLRSVLVDMARQRIAEKRSAELVSLTAGLHIADKDGTPEQLVALDESLRKLGKMDKRLERVAEMRIIMGMDTQEIADALSVSEPTVKRDWQRAKAFIYHSLGSST